MAKQKQTPDQHPAKDRQRDAPPVRPYVERLEWRRSSLIGQRVLWMVMSDGTAAPVRETDG